jgi:hypothetical protein
MSDSHSEVTPRSSFLRIFLPVRSSILVLVLLPFVGHFLAELSMLKLTLAAFLIAYSAAHAVDYLPPFPFRFPDSFLAESPNAVFALGCALGTLWPRLLVGVRLAGWSPLEVLRFRLFSGLVLIGVTMALYGLADFLRDRRDDAVDLADAFPTHDQALL